MLRLYILNGMESGHQCCILSILVSSTLTQDRYL
jgi:hypothetical protein